MRAKPSWSFSALVVVGSAVFSLLPRSAQAAGVIMACVNNTNGQVRIVDADTPCKVPETRIQWNSGTGGGASAGAIMGQVTSCGDDMTRTLVYVEGRAFTVYTGADGKFLIDTVPAGTYKVVIERNGQVVGQVASVVVDLSVNAGLVNLNTLSVANTQSDPNNCGACGNACQAGQVCTGGVCGCGPGQTLCGGTCVNTLNDPLNCGACGTSCGAGVCDGGVCTLTCEVTKRDCDNNLANGCEVDITIDPNNCGGCGLTCGAGQSCVAGACTGGQQLWPNGSPCASGFACQSGFCTDGFCCNQACGGTCQACAGVLTGGVNGACGAILANTDPKDQCAATPQFTCGTTGVCNGAGACTLWPSGTQCVGPQCFGGTQFAASMCNGAGNCVQGTAQSCNPYVCGPTQCKTSCSTNADCTSGYVCSAGACVPAQPNGAACGSPSDCLSAFCAGGVCCNTACTGAGQTCQTGTCISSDFDNASFVTASPGFSSARQ
jgi:hypothetical protein